MKMNIAKPITKEFAPAVKTLLMFLSSLARLRVKKSVAISF